MIQYLITGLAGIAIGIVGWRLWSSGSFRAQSTVPAEDEVSPAMGTAVEGSLPGRSKRPLLIGAGAILVAGIAILVLKPSGTGNTTPDAAPVGGEAGAANKELDDVDTMINRLAARLEKEPNDGEGFRMLGWSYVMTGKPEKAIAPYRRAIALLPSSGPAQAGLGEALTGIAGNQVTPEAKAAFDKALSLDPTEPRARYFNGLWLSQHGNDRDALDKWIALANSAPADTPWQTEVRKQITQVSQKLGVDVSGKLKSTPALPTPAIAGPDAATVQAASQLPPAQQAAMVDGMVEGLAAKLKANPKNVDGWIMLLRSRMVKKQADKAGEDLIAARRGLSSDAAGLARVNEAAAQIGVPGAR